MYTFVYTVMCTSIHTLIYTYIIICIHARSDTSTTAARAASPGTANKVATLRALGPAVAVPTAATAVASYGW